MPDTLFPIKLPPGVYRNGTKYQAQDRWYDSHLVRWIEGTIQPIGGWRLALDTTNAPLGAVSGVPRAMHAWRSSSGPIKVGIGTNSRAYVLIEGAVTDITPVGFVAGDEDSVFVAGSYGSGTYSSGLYGTGSLAQTLNDAGTWQLDNFGDSLAGVMSDDGKLYVWDGNTANKFVQAPGSPVNNRAVVVTPERFLVVLGAGGNPRKVQWPSRETTDTWAAASTNTAGGFELATNGRLMAGRRARNNTLLWTDTDVHDMTYIGGTLLYGFNRVGEQCGLIAPNAVAMVDGRAIWMGKDKFFEYDGFVRPVPCEVRDYVFEDFNTTQSAKVTATTLSQFGEIWWYYPSAGASENDRYVVYNYLEKHWAVGRLPRTAGIDRGATPNPILCAPARAAQGTLTSTGTNVANGDTVTIAGKVYTFQTVLTNVDGNVLIGASAAASLQNLLAAINVGAGAGASYAAAMTLHPSVQAESTTATTLVVRAKASGTGGNALATTEVSAQLSWGGATLASGGASAGFAVGDIYEHEVLEDRGSEVPYLESGPFELGNGDRVVELKQLVPDDKTLGDVRAYIYGSFYPDQPETTYGPYTLAALTDLRIAARQIRIRFEQATATSWRVGVPRIGASTGGYR